MLNAILSHWAIYGYAAYVLVILILCVIYRKRPVRVSRTVWRLPKEAEMLPARWQSRALR